MMRHVQEYRTYGGKISVNGNSYYVKVVVRLQKMGFSYYTMWTFQTKKIKVETKDPANPDYKSGAKPNSSTFVKDSIPWWLNEVKTKLQKTENMLAVFKTVRNKNEVFF